MKWLARYHPEFDRDVQEHGQWLEDNSPGMGEKFVQEVRAVLHRLVARPLTHPPLFERYRRILVPRFKVVIPYFVDDNVIYVVGVVHSAREIRRWIGRRLATAEEE